MFSCTDTVLLTFVCGFSVVSVYSIYNLVITGISSVLTIVVESLTYIFGQTYNKSLKAYYYIHDSFKMLYMMIAFVLGSCAVILYVPFVELYVGNSDITYADKYLAILFPLILVLNSTRRIDNLLSSFSGHAKQTLNQVLIELGINVALSVSLVFFIGIYGVLIGTAAAIFYRFISSIRYNEEAILFRPKMCGYKYGMIDLIIFAVVAILSALIKIQAANFFSFILYGIISFIVMSVVYLGINYLVIKDDFMNMLRFAKDILINKIQD